MSSESLGQTEEDCRRDNYDQFLEFTKQRYSWHKAKNKEP